MRYAVYVEGLSEMLFVADVLQKYSNYDPIQCGFQCVNLNADNYDRLNSPRQGDMNSANYYQIVNVNNDNFVKPKDADAYFAIQPWEEQILQDKSLDYRVLNLTTSTFNDSRTSYRLKSIGGYSAVKLRRYQDLIDEHISKMNWNVLNMLNTKYIVTRQGVYPNPDAMGNAWFVNDVQFVPTPDDESAALNTLDLTKSAVADEKFREALTCEPQPNENDEIVLTEYQPNALTYHSSTANDRVAVFSEIYYPEGWHIYVDGKEITLGRVNYVLRAAVIPAGEHIIKMEFIPDIIKKDNWCLVLLIMALIGGLASIGWYIYENIKEE